MKAQDFVSVTPPWFNVVSWENWVTKSGIFIGRGDRHNRTDGEAHYILHAPNGETYNVHANTWDYRCGWQGAIDWVESTFMSKSWIELIEPRLKKLAAHGGKYYIRPQLSQETIDELNGDDKQIYSNIEAKWAEILKRFPNLTEKFVL